MRYYDPDLASWTSVDLVPQYFDKYNYCGGNPINKKDPDGQASYDVDEWNPFPAIIAPGEITSGDIEIMKMNEAAAKALVTFYTTATPIGAEELVAGALAKKVILKNPKLLVVLESHFKDLKRVFQIYKDNINLFKKEFWQHVLPHKHVYRLEKDVSKSTGNIRKTFQKEGAVKQTKWPWQED